MKPRAWRWLTLGLSFATIAVGLLFITKLIASGSPMQAQPWGYVLSGGALVSWLAGERWRRALHAELAIIDRLNDELARVRARRLR